MKKVRKRASPTRTWFGGICCVLKACRSKDRTIIIRVKEVTRINIAGEGL